MGARLPPRSRLHLRRVAVSRIRSHRAAHAVPVPPQPVPTVSEPIAVTTTVSTRLNHASECIKAQESKVAHDYVSYRKAEVLWRRSTATLAEWQLRHFELERCLQESVATGKVDALLRTRLGAPSPSRPDVERSSEPTP